MAKSARKNKRRVCTFHGEQYVVTETIMESSVAGKFVTRRFEVLTGPARGCAGGGRDVRKEHVHKAARFTIKHYASKEA